MKPSPHVKPAFNVLRGACWCRVTTAPEVSIDAAGWALAERHSPGNPRAFWEPLLPRLEAAEPLQPYFFELPWGANRSLALEALRLPPGPEVGCHFLLRDAALQRAAFDSMARAQALIELSYEGFTIFDAQATIVYECASNARINGYQQEECVGRSLFEFIHPEDTERLMPRFARLAERPGELDTDIVRWRHRDGHWIYLEGTVVNQLGDPHIRGMINTFHDVTARVEMERALTEAKEAAEAFQAKQQRFLAMLSHELRTPLALIKQPLEALIAEGSGGDASCGMVDRGLRRMEALVEELVDFTVLDSGQARLRAREVVAAVFLAEWVAELGPLAEARQMSLRLVDEVPGVAVYVDPAKFGKVLGNLIGNAIKFAPAGSEIVVRCREPSGADADCFEMEVEDAGTPIPEAERARIFERYYQGDSGDARGWEGMGLGLSLAAEMVALHGGEIGLRDGESGGNCFWVRLPLGAEHIAMEEIALDDENERPPPQHLKVFQAVPSPTVPSPESLPDGEASGSAARVLIVEDHPDLRRFLAQQLEAVYTLQFAENGAEALPMILSDPPDLVLSDVMMPGLDGIRLCEKVREHFSARDLPIILLSAKGRGQDRLEGLRAGASDYLSKPFSMDELRLRMHTHLSVRRVSQAVPTAWPEQVRAVVDEFWGKGPFGAAELAEALGLSQRQLQRRCIEAFGQTPGQLIQEVRLRHARHLLESGEVDSVAAAAEAVGLSQSYLSRRFRAVFNQAAKTFLCPKPK